MGNRVLERIFGPNRDEVMGGSITLHNEEFPRQILLGVAPMGEEEYIPDFGRKT
jgi:hypothetical protein